MCVRYCSFKGRRVSWVVLKLCTRLCKSDSLRTFGIGATHKHTCLGKARSSFGAGSSCGSITEQCQRFRRRV